MLSAGILIAVFALAAVAALYLAVRVLLAGRRRGRFSESRFAGAQFISAPPSAARPSEARHGAQAETGDQS